MLVVHDTGIGSGGLVVLVVVVVVGGGGGGGVAVVVVVVVMVMVMVVVAVVVVPVEGAGRFVVYCLLVSIRPEGPPTRARALSAMCFSAPGAFAARTVGLVHLLPARLASCVWCTEGNLHPAHFASGLMLLS